MSSITWLNRRTRGSTKRVFPLVLASLLHVSVTPAHAQSQFGAEQTIDALLGPPVALKAADIDGDGKLDIVACRAAGSTALVWYPNLGGGLFGAPHLFPQEPTSANQVLTFDFGSDADTDVLAVVADSASPSGLLWHVVLYENQGGGTFAPPVSIQAPGSVAHIGLADFEGDGDLDLFLVRGVVLQVMLFQGTTYTPTDFSHNAGGIDTFALLDVEGDGDTDLIATAQTPGQVLLMVNLGLFMAFSGPHVIDGAFPGVSGVDIADVDGDGLRDVVAAGTFGSSELVRWYKNLGPGSFGSPITIASTGAPQLSVCTDVDGDGDQDVVVEELHGAAWYENAGSGSFGAAKPITTNASTSRAMILADLDGDGVLDLVLGSDTGSGGRLAWFRNGLPPYAAFCSGDGSGTPCPCGNSGGSGNGCASSVHPGGANLAATGYPSVVNDSFVLVGTHMPSSAALYFQGTMRTAGGSGTLFGDGLRCAGGSIARLGTKINVGGSSAYPTVADVPVSIKGGNAPGNVREYQCWYRNAAPFCTPSTFNLTNGVEATWAP